MKYVSKPCFLAILFFTLAAPNLAAQAPDRPLVGTWESIDEDTRLVVQVYVSSYGKIAGKIIGAFDSQGRYYASPIERCPQLIAGFSRSQTDTWINGRIIDPEDGRSYSGRITLLSETLLVVRAYRGIFWQDMQWKKIKKPPFHMTSRR